MCDCRTVIEEKLLTRIKEKQPEATDIDVRLSNYVYVIGDTVQMKPSTPLDGSYKMPTKKGGLKTVRIRESIIASYCPFCGESLRSEPKAKQGE